MNNANKRFLLVFLRGVLGILVLTLFACGVKAPPKPPSETAYYYYEIARFN